MNGLKSEFLKKTRRVQAVDLAEAWPEMNGRLFVGKLTVEERGTLHAQAKQSDGMPSNYHALLVVLAACDSSGARLFTMDDLPDVCAMEIETLDPIVDAMLAFNHMDESPEEKAKNSGSTPNAS